MEHDGEGKNYCTYPIKTSSGVGIDLDRNRRGQTLNHSDQRFVASGT